LGSVAWRPALRKNHRFVGAKIKLTNTDSSKTER
jgi:hypothetical protein